MPRSASVHDESPHARVARRLRSAAGPSAAGAVAQTLRQPASPARPAGRRPRLHVAQPVASRSPPRSPSARGACCCGCRRAGRSSTNSSAWANSSPRQAPLTAAIRRVAWTHPPHSQSSGEGARAPTSTPTSQTSHRRAVHFTVMNPPGSRKDRVTPAKNTASPERKTPELQGHALGIVDRPADCETLTKSLISGDFPSARIIVLQGADGMRRLQAIMDGSRWGESVEEFLEYGARELQAGHCVVCVEVHDAVEAQTVAAISTQHGGHHICHLGSVVDARLTA